MLRILATFVVGAGSLYWIKYRKKIKSLPDAKAPPLALVGRDKLPIIGIYFRLRDIITDPVGLVSRCRAHYGDSFTIRVPFNFDLIYLCKRDDFRFLMGMDSDIATFGPVLKNVPVVGFGFPRSSFDTDHLQKLSLALRRFIASRFVDGPERSSNRHVGRRRKVRLDSPGKRRLDLYQADIHRIVNRHLDTWSNRFDLVPAVVHAIYDASCHCLFGDTLWSSIRKQAIPLLRDIAQGIEIPRATLCKTPLFSFIPEGRAAKKLYRLLKNSIDQHKKTGCFPFIDNVAKISVDGKPIQETDVPWALMYILWNATSYPGAYGIWSLIDLIRHPAHLERIRNVQDGASYWEALENCFTETTRLHPLSSIPRSLAQDVIYEHNGQRIYLPKNALVATFPYDLNRDEADFVDAHNYDPLRYQDKLPHQPIIFGRGPFSCVAQQFVRILIPTMMDAIIERFDIDFESAIPERLCCVHLTYPAFPIRVHLRRRERQNHIKGQKENQQEVAVCPFTAAAG